MSRPFALEEGRFLLLRQAIHKTQQTIAAMQNGRRLLCLRTGVTFAQRQRWHPLFYGLRPVIFICAALPLKTGGKNANN